MEIIQNFGFEPVFFVAQVINFLILAFIFKKFLYKPVLGMLASRQKQIEKGLKDAEESTKILAQAEEKKDEIIQDATKQAEKIIEETKSSAAELSESLMASSKEESEKIIQEAKLLASAEFEKVRNQAQDMALELSRTILERVTSEIFTKSEKQKILERGITRLKNYEKQ